MGVGLLVAVRLKWDRLDVGDGGELERGGEEDGEEEAIDERLKVERERDIEIFG
jgi:hypothetical protein